MEMVIRKNIVKLGKHILLFALVISSLAGCTPSDKATVEKSLEISLKNAEIIESKDSHGGFHGDGRFFCSLECPSDSVLNQIESNEHWQERWHRYCLIWVLCAVWAFITAHVPVGSLPEFVLNLVDETADRGF